MTHPASWTSIRSSWWLSATDPRSADGLPNPLRLQHPLPKPDMKFSFIRLSPRQSTAGIPPMPLGLASRPKHMMMVSLLPACAEQFPVMSTPGYRSFALARLCCPRRLRYYYRLRPPLDAGPLPGATGYRFRCYRAPQAGDLRPRCRCRDGSLLFRQWAVRAFHSPYADGVLRCCKSKLFAPSMAFARPLGLGSRCFPLMREVHDAAGFALCYGLRVCSTPEALLS